MAETIHVLTESGMVLAMDLPLNEGIAGRLEKGYLRRVNEDGSEWKPGASKDPKAAAPAVEAKPAQADTKAKWVGYAVRVLGLKPDDADAMTKGDLIEAVARHEAAAGA